MDSSDIVSPARRCVRLSVSEPPRLPSACQLCAVRSQSLCADLSPRELGALNAISRRRSFQPGQVVVMEGDPDVFGNVVNGLLAEKKTMADGREQIVSLLFPADFHGNPLNDRADTTVHAVSPTTVCVFERGAFERLADEFPSLKSALLDHSLAALADARDWMLLLGQMSAGERVATFLLRMADRQAEAAGCSHHPNGLADGAVVEIPITRAQMAAYLGLTIETVSRRLTALRDSRLIDFESSRAVRLVSIDQLRAAAGGSPQLN